ncbi:SpaH/EbpB family LPXTG-anchored major pilin [Actinotignum sanguinis]|uniref:SpaH/EbpB family LPXTG-anchored major pilin n=1 Tax=Actinotignum sanguinis TaxID=1445614 RepID=UPI0029349854|nr:SpaH/EbpB family LPXTG-anchored major pilin [Actinotignum sanguinis]MDV2437551.1 SpaH/EbpB family LPXTG-anchored major pilin [Actinotignum sanguinis]
MTRKKSLRALVAACALALTGMGIGVANAAPASDPAPAGAPVAPWAANAPTTGSITITKQDAATKKPVNGDEFTVTKVDSLGDVTLGDMKKVSDWETVAGAIKDLNANPDSPKAKLSTTAVHKVKTTGEGKAVVENLPLGLYKIVESEVPAGYTSDIKPFFMTVPEITGTSSADQKYTYDVEVTPKNTDARNLVSKTGAFDKVVGAGDDISYTISATLNKKGPIKGSDIKDFAIFDDAPTNAYQSVEASAVKSVKVNGTAIDASQYTITTPTEGVEADRTRLQVNFTEDGLNTIAAKATASEAPVVTVDLSFTLKSDLTLDSVSNKFGFIPGHSDSEPTPGPVVPEPGPTPGPGPEPGPGPTPNPFPTIELYDFQIAKTNASDGKPLAAAKFAAFASLDDAKACVALKDRTSCQNASKGFGTKETGADGLTPKFKAKKGEAFYVVEVEAPAKFIRSDEITTVTVTDQAGQVFKLGIKNVPTKDSGKWFDLPKTGAIGVGIFALAGAGLVAGGALTHLRSRKRNA